MSARSIAAAFTLMAFLSTTAWGADHHLRNTTQPAQNNVVTVMGQVVRPASYQFPSSENRLIDVLEQAGGLSSQANNTVRIIRNGKFVGQVFLTPNSKETVFPNDLLIVDGAISDHAGTVFQPAQQFQPYRLSEQNQKTNTDEMQIAFAGLQSHASVIKIRKKQATVAHMLAILGQNPEHPVRVVAPPRSKWRLSPNWRNTPLPANSVLVFKRELVKATPLLATLPKPIYSTLAPKAETVAPKALANQSTSTSVSPQPQNVRPTPAAPKQVVSQRVTANSQVKPAAASDDEFIELPAPPPQITEVPIDRSGVDSTVQMLPPPPLDDAPQMADETTLDGIPMADADQKAMLGQFTPLTQLPDYRDVAKTTALAAKTENATEAAKTPVTAQAASTNLLSFVVGTIGFLVAGSALIILVSMARKATRSEKTITKHDVHVSTPNTILDDLIRDRIPMVEEANHLPTTMRFFGHPTGPEKIRIDARHDLTGPHFEATFPAQEVDTTQSMVQDEQSPQMRFDAHHSPNTNPKNRHKRASRVLDRVLSNVHDRGES